MPSLTTLSPESFVSYLVALLVPLGDAIVPAFPSEEAIIALGVASVPGLGLGVLALVALAALGAFLGDNISYRLGRRYGARITARLMRGEKGRRREAWAARTLERHGAVLIIACRFIPGGRTAVTLTAGVVGYSPRRFLWATAVAAVLWANYAFWIGRLGGATFQDNAWAAFLLSTAIVLVIGGIVTVVRRLRGSASAPS